MLDASGVWERTMPLRKWGIFACTIVLAAGAFARAGEQKELGLVDTSIGLKPTSTKKKLALITDPVLKSADPGLSPSDYIPVEGLLDNHFDPTEFQLDTSPATGTFSTDGSTVAGIAPYEVLGFEVQTIDGGLINVQDNGQGGDAVTQVTSGSFDPSGGPVGGGETGNVYDIHFKIVNNEESTNPPLTSDQDQDFYQLFLTQIGTDLPGDDTVFTTPDSFVTFAESPAATADGVDAPPETVTFGQIQGAVIPEASTAAFLGLAGTTLLMRRRRAKRERLAEQATSPTQA
jgi:hypothetical protein